METERPQVEEEEVPEPGKPLRPDPGGLETPGGSMELASDEPEPQASD